ncbi:MAG: hypothetical protein IPM34_00440 [Saprospiraceae bacterium]|nr:hypothetical protein [Saprospiraceae bacterium]
MKHTHFLISMFIFCLISCDQDRELLKENNLSIRNNTTSYQITGIPGYQILLKTKGNAQDEIYILSTNSVRDFQQHIEVRQLRELDSGLEIELDSGDKIRWMLGNDPVANVTGYSLAKVSGNYYHPFFYGYNGPLSNPDVDKVSCKCKENTIKASCDHGGRGATECSVEHGGTLVGSGIQMKCNVKCEPGYYACCKNIEL